LGPVIPVDQGKVIPVRVRSFKATDEQWAAIQAKASALGVSTGELIRQAIDSYHLGSNDHGEDYGYKQDPQQAPVPKRTPRIEPAVVLPAGCNLCTCMIPKADIRFGSCDGCSHPRFNHSAS
jgi:hypothetical protein